MTTSNPTIFRTEALEYRLRNQGWHETEVTFPRSMARCVAISLWILLGLLGGSGAAACFAPVPVSGSGFAIVTGTPATTSETMIVAVLMPKEYGPRLHPGVDVKVFPGTSESAITGTMATIELQPLDSTTAEQRLGFPASSLAMLKGPMLFVTVNVDADAASMLAPGVTSRAGLPVGSRHEGAFLPLVGRLFRSDI